MDLSRIHILVVDRDPGSAQSICEILGSIGYQVSFALNERDALLLTEKRLFNLVLKGFDDEPIDAIAFMEKILAITPDTEFIFISTRGTIRTAIDAIRKGAYDYLSKPVDADQLAESVAKALEHQSLVAQNQQLKLRLRRRSEPDIFVGRSGALQEITQLIGEIAPTEVTVLIQGASGTGKEIVARAIHEKSRRKAGPFIAVNCAALSDGIIESEFFGHVKGAFTGAISDRPGRFQLAHGGTLFLDEIADLSPKGQGDLLRVLEDGAFRPVGSPRLVQANTRIIAATNKNLEEVSMDGGFREDLFYRLNIVFIQLPLLRERVEDIPSLIDSFARHFCARHRRRPKRFSPEVVRFFQTLPWPGNVRQLRNVVERLVVTVSHSQVEMADLPPSLQATSRPDQGLMVRAGMTFAQVEAELIRQTLLRVTSKREEAARILGISRRSLQYKIRRYGLENLPRTSSHRKPADGSAATPESDADHG